MSEWNTYTSPFLSPSVCFLALFPPAGCLSLGFVLADSSLVCYKALRCYFCRVAYVLRSCWKTRHFKVIMVSRSRKKGLRIWIQNLETVPFLRTPLFSKLETLKCFLQFLYYKVRAEAHDNKNNRTKSRKTSRDSFLHKIGNPEVIKKEKK